MKVTFRHFGLLIIVIFLLVSCGSNKRVVTTKKRQTEQRVSRPSTPVSTEPEKKTETAVDQPVSSVKKSAYATSTYISNFKDAAIKEMRLYGIPASITLAQGILESGSGNARLAREANNHFGIKCHREWTGARIYHDDDELAECFRKYNDPTYSYRDHSLFLTERKRYAQLFDLEITDYKKWAKGLRSAGYATDRKYPQKLISIIERYNLDQYDEIGSGLTSQRKSGTIRQVENDENIKLHVVQAGETLYAISRKYNMSIDQIKKINELKTSDLKIGQILKLK